MGRSDTETAGVFLNGGLLLFPVLYFFERRMMAQQFFLFPVDGEELLCDTQNCAVRIFLDLHGDGECPYCYQQGKKIRNEGYDPAPAPEGSPVEAEQREDPLRGCRFREEHGSSSVPWTCVFSPQCGCDHDSQETGQSGLES